MKYLYTALFTILLTGCASDPDYEFGDHSKKALEIALTAAELAIIFCELHPEHDKCNNE